MHKNCIQAVQQAAGRALTQAEIKKIDDKISSTMRQLARSDPSGWRAKSADQRVIDAAQQAMADIEAEANLKVQRAQLQILKTASTDTRIGDLMAAYAEGRSRGLVREMELTSHYIEGIKRESVSSLMTEGGLHTGRVGTRPYEKPRPMHPSVGAGSNPPALIHALLDPAVNN